MKNRKILICKFISGTKLLWQKSVLFQQRSHIPQAIITVVETDHMIEKREQEAKLAREERLRKEAEEMLQIRKDAEKLAAQKEREQAEVCAFDEFRFSFMAFVISATYVDSLSKEM